MKVPTVVSGECLLPGLQVAFFSWYPHMGESRERERGEASSLMSLLIRALITFMRTPPSWPNYLAKALHPSRILGVRILAWEFWGGYKHSVQHKHKSKWSREVNYSISVNYTGKSIPGRRNSKCKALKQSSFGLFEELYKWPELREWRGVLGAQASRAS